jgi:hypothetical protein
MSYQTVEVVLEDGRVSTRGAETLPAKAHALLTIIDPVESPVIKSTGSLADRLQHLAGIGRGEYTDLSTNKAYLDGLGR